MAVPMSSGVVQGLEGILIKSSPNGEKSLVKLGAPVNHGDVLVLLSGNAYIHMIGGFPEALALNRPMQLDGISPLLKGSDEQSIVQQIVEEALAKGIDPVPFLALLEETAAGEEILGEGGNIFILDPMYGLGAVNAGYPTIGVSFDMTGTREYVTLYDPDDFLISQAANIPDITLPNPFNIDSIPVVVDETDGLNSVTNPMQSSAAASEISSVVLQANGATWDPESKTLKANDGSWEIEVGQENNQIKFKFTQLTPVQHPDDGDPNDNIVVPVDVQAVRNDGATAHSQFTVTIYDDGPAILSELISVTQPLQVDETNINAGTATMTVDFSQQFINAIDYGTDDTPAYPGQTQYELGINAAQVGSGLFAIDNNVANGKGSEIQLINDAGTIRGIANGQEYFNITVDSNGHVTLTQLAAIWHAITTDNNDLSPLATTNNADLYLRVTAIDGDGDHVSYDLGIGQNIFSFLDDGPYINAEAVKYAEPAKVDETNIDAGTASVTVNYADNFQPAINYGEDGPGHTTYQLGLSNQGVPSGLYAVDPNQPDGKGGQILLVQIDSQTIVGQLNGQQYFSFTLDANNGNLTFSQQINVWHANPDNHNELSLLNTLNPNDMFIQATVTDADGDSVDHPLALGQGVFAIFDDGPKLTGQYDIGKLVYEDALPQGNDDPGQTLQTNGSLLPLVDFGEDGPKGFELTDNYLTTLQNLGLTSDDQPLNYSSNEVGGVINVFAHDHNGNDVFTFSFNKTTGTYTFTLQGPLDHPAPPIAVGDDTQALSINLGAIINAIDGDNDHVSLDGKLAVKVQDDLPVANDDCAMVTEPSALLNIYYIVDVSGSMGYQFNPATGETLPGNPSGSPNRLELAREALINLTNQYANYSGEVLITIVPFASGAGTSGAFSSQTFDILNGDLQDALDFIAGLEVSEDPIPGQNTEYNDALAVARDGLEDDIAPESPISNYQHVVYFLSDGMPNPASAGAPASWQTFVDSNNINVIPVGIGDFQTAPLALVGNAGDTIIEVLNPTDLSAALIEQLDNVVTGNVLTNDSFGGDGPGTPKIVTLTYEGTNYQYNDPGVINNKITVTDLLGGKLEFNFATGDYTYIAPQVSQDEQVHFQYTIVDNDGDQDIGQLTIKIDNLEPPEVTLLTKTIEFARDQQGQQPYGDAEVAEYLLQQARGNEGQVVTAVPINGVDLSNTFIEVATPVTVKFISEGAGHQNMVGYYLFDSNGDIIADSAGFIWLDATATPNPAGSVGGTNLITNTTAAFGFNQSATFNLPNVPAGQGIGFFLIEDGADVDSGGINNINANTIKNGNYGSMDNLNENVSIVNGQVRVGNTTLTGNVYFSHDRALNTDANTFPAGHVLSGVTFNQQDPSLADYAGLLIIGFEDLLNGGDRDYNDLIFSVDLGANIQNFATSSAPIVESVTDPDSQFLTKAVISTDGFLNGDALNFISTAGQVEFNTVTQEVKVVYNGVDHFLTYTLVNDGSDPDFTYIFTALNPAQLVPVAAYEMMLKAINFTPVADVASEDHEREVTVSVTDDSGLVDTAITHFNVVINDTLPINLIQFTQGQFDFGLGNDIVLIPDNMDGLGKAKGGHGVDIVKFEDNNMNLTAAETKAHFNGGWEQVDTTGHGSNALSLDFDSVLALSMGSELNLHLNNGQSIAVLQIKADGGVGGDTINLGSPQVEDVSNLLAPPQAPGASEQLFKLTNADASQHVYVHVVSPTQELPTVNVTEG